MQVTRGSWTLSYQELLTCWLRGMRNGNWRQLRVMERIFYKAAMCYAKMKHWITSSKIIGEVREVADKLRTTVKKRIMDLGKERIKEMLLRFRERGVLGWARQLEAWLRDEAYVFWLGLSSQTSHSCLA